MSIPSATRHASPLIEWTRVEPDGTWPLTDIMETHGGVLLAFGHRGTIIRSVDDGVTWTAAHTETDDWLQSGAIAANGALVVVGDDGAIVRSIDDGKSWSTVESHTRRWFTFVRTMPSGVLIALADEGVVARSTDDGASWSLVESGTKAWLRDLIATPDGALIAVGWDAAIVRSVDDGASWTVVHEKADGYLSEITTTPGGALVALGSSIMRSVDDGVTWSTVHASSVSVGDVTMTARGDIVAVSGLIGEVIRSEDDGMSWSVTTTPAKHALSSVTSPSPNVVVAAGGFGTMVRSTDGGRNWSAVDVNSGLSLRMLHGSPRGSLIAVGDNTILRSTDGGVTWAAAENHQFLTLSSVAVAPPSTFIAVGFDGAIIRSADGGRTWSRAYNELESWVWSVAATRGGNLIAVGDDGAILRSVDDGITWSATFVGKEGLRTAASTHDGALLVSTYRGGILRSTDDGISWSTVYRGPEGVLLDMVTTPGRGVIAVGAKGTVLRSGDGGAHWQPIESGTSNSLERVIRTAAGTLVAVGDHGTLMLSSDDGMRWSLAATVTEKNFNSVVATPGGTLIAVGEDGVIARSRDDGAQWAAILTDTRAGLNDIALTPKGALVAVGDDGTVVTSHDDGVSWVAVSVGADLSLHQAIVGPRGEVIVASSAGVILSGVDSSTRVPVIRRITQSYSSVKGHPLLRFELDDPTDSCRDIGCLAVEARSEADHERGVAPRTLPVQGMTFERDGRYSIVIDPAFLSAQRPDPLYVRVRLRTDRYVRTYPDADSYFEIANHPAPLYRKLWFIPAVIATGLLALYGLLVLRPLWLLGLVSRPQLLDAIPSSGLSAFGEFCVALLRAVLMPVLVRNPRVLDAWVRCHRDALRIGFESIARRAVDRGVPYTPLAMENPDGAVFVPSPQTLLQYLQAQRVSVQIVGAGGSGKTRFAAELGRWLFEGRGFVLHPAAAIFINESFEDLPSIVQEKLRALLGDATPPAEFIDALLCSGRVWVIVDGLSERSATTRIAVAKVYRAVSVKFMVCTMRYSLDCKEAEVTRLRTRPLDSVALHNFLADQLRAANAMDLFANVGDQTDLAQRFSRQIKVGEHEAPVTPLLVRIFVNQAIGLARSGGSVALNDLPSSIPEAYFTYVESLDAIDHHADTESLRRRELARFAAAAIAELALGEDLRPKPVALTLVEQALLADARIDGAAVETVQRMVDNGLLMRHFNGTEATVEFVLDPLAECLAAFQHAKRCGGDVQAWEALVSKVAQGGETTRGFMLALHMVHAAYARALGFPRVDFPAYPPVSSEAEHQP